MKPRGAQRNNPTTNDATCWRPMSEHNERIQRYYEEKALRERAASQLLLMGNLSEGQQAEALWSEAEAMRKEKQ